MLSKKRGIFLQSLQLNFKLTGWWPAALSAVFLVSSYFFLDSMAGSGNSNAALYLSRAIEIIVPLGFAIHAAFVLSPDSEPAIELLFSYPVPPPFLFLDRLVLVVCMHLAIALIATLVFSPVWSIVNLVMVIIRWLIAGMALAGVAVFTTQITRQGIFGALMATFLWGASLYGGDNLLTVWKWFWPFHVYLQPDELGIGTYFLNRLVLALFGICLFTFAMRLMGDQDRLLGNR